jgi:hypothetical protein
VLASGDAIAQSNSFDLTTGVKFFDYAEYGDDGAFLDGEKGWVLGIGAAYEHHMSNDMVLSVFGDIFEGEVDYDGHLQSGTPLTTKTDEAFYSLGVGLQFPLPILNNRVDLFSDVSYQQWERDILPTARSARLFEVYEWWEISLGAECLIVKATSSNLSIYGRAYQISNPAMQIDLVSFGYGKPTLDLGEEVGGELGFRWMFPVSTEQQIGLLGSYKFWEFGRSDDKRVVRDDNEAAITIHEPRSETNTFTIQMTFKTDF